MSENPQASIIIPVYNKLALTRKCIDAIYANTPSSLNWEIIVVDNGSSDGTVYETPRDAKTLFLRNSQNLGFAKASNYGASVSRAKYLVFLNNDTEVQPGWLDALLNELKFAPASGLVGARLIYSDFTIQHAGVAIMANRMPWHIHVKKNVNDPLVTRKKAFPCITGACMAARREEFIKLGGFDEEYLNGYEDVDLCLRYRKAGFKCIYRPDCVVIHHESQSSGRHDHDGRNVVILKQKWGDYLIQDSFMHMAPEPADRRKGLRCAIKIGCPNRNEIHWGDIYYSESFAKELARAGHSCEIHYLDEWDSEDRDIDVVIHLAGFERYRLKPWNINIMWMISHPDRHPLEELEKYDGIAIASTPYAEHLSKLIKTPVRAILQAADPELFTTESRGERASATLREGILFVGNNGGRNRPLVRTMVKWLLPDDPMDLPEFKCSIYGTGWEKLIAPQLIGGYCEWRRQPELFRKALILLNDHHSDMAEHGFINDRTYQAMGCGVPLISDRVRGLEDALDIPQASSRKDLQEIIRDMLAHPDEYKRRAEKNREIFLNNYTFAKRVKEFEKFIQAIDSRHLRERLEKEEISHAIRSCENGFLRH